jgi:hypothetical protein
LSAWSAFEPRIGALAPLHQVIERGIRRQARTVRQAPPPFEKKHERRRAIQFHREPTGCLERTLWRTEALDVHELADVLRREDRGIGRLPTALGMPEQPHALPERAQHLHDVAHVEHVRVAIRPIRFAVPTRIDRDHPIAFREIRREQIEATTVIPHPVAEHERLTLGITPFVQAQAKPSRVKVSRALRRDRTRISWSLLDHAASIAAAMGSASGL